MKDFFTGVSEEFENIATKFGLATKENIRLAEEALLVAVVGCAETWSKGGVDRKYWGNSTYLYRLNGGGFTLEREIDDFFSQDSFRAVVMIGEEEKRLFVSSITETSKTRSQRWDEVKANELKGKDRLGLLKALVR